MDRPESGKQDTLESRAYEALKTAIITGVYPPGGQVVEELVAKQLEMSRSPVRIAIKRLQAEGFLERYPNKRIYVAMADAQKTVDALYIREALEGMASRLAALYRDDTDVEQLRAAEAALDRCARRRSSCTGPCWPPAKTPSWSGWPPTFWTRNRCSATAVC